MRAFIVRPFGQKEGIDFDRVERELIQPALRRLRDLGVDVSGGTTGEISRAGNIREDMFRLLVIADLVIADVSVHNANAFYELGIRHALRPRHTFMIRSETPHKYPFDLQTDRYFLYDAANPASEGGTAVEELAKAIRSTLASPGPSSPIFQLLPDLRPHERTKLVKVPRSFAEDVERARRDGQGGDLRLYAQEVQAFEWDQEGLRMVGEAQFKLRAYAGARETFESLRTAVPDDPRANQRLGTIYQRLAFAGAPDRREGLLARSDQAIRRALDAAATASDRAEVLALLASNAKSRWIDEFRAAAPEAKRVVALRSSHFGEMLDLYLKAANADLNAHYPGVNALAMLQTQISLARSFPDEWQEAFDEDAAATDALEQRQQLASRLVCSLSLALEMDDVMGKREGVADPWAVSSRADLMLFTVRDRPQRVTQAYRQALNGADWFTLEAARRNLGLFQELGLFEPNVSAALAVVDAAIGKSEPPQQAPERIILFTGHMVDARDRPKDKMRFPPTAKAEAIARRLIEDAIRAELQGGNGNVIGIAGGACGGDILFHEVCQALKIPTRLMLALPPNEFQVASVQRGGPAWVERYQTLCERVPPRVLQDGEVLPDWLADKPNYDVWQRNNLWMMFNALATDARRLTLIALYNRDRDPDGPGGTADLVQEARNWGFKGVELDARELLVE
ncbi:MAG TPA: tetratricopeptide repeat-containing protein [Candidatus Dormibacteraeota bacterium]|nr:tetratricopeptide repeat-containing protein [Candidatus Dormibacteraeota bacterium]